MSADTSIDGSSGFREEKDTMGIMQVPDAALWGAQTQRSLENFRISSEKMPIAQVHALAMVKKACASVNAELGQLPADKAKAIIENVIQWTTWDTGSQFLGAAMVSQGISLCYDWMHPKFTSTERKAIADKLYTLAIKPTIDACTAKNYWTQWYGNWAFVCIGGVGSAVADARDLFLARHLDRDIDQVLHDGLDVAADIAHLGELGGLDLDEGRVREPRQAAGDLGLATAGGPDHQDVLGRDFLAQRLRHLHAAPAVAQRDRDSAFGGVLADDVLVQFADDLARRQ